MYLNCHSYFSLRYGTLSPDQLLQLGQELGQETLCLTDVNNTSACLSFLQLAPRFNIRPLVGIDFRRGVQPFFVGIARNNQGFLELNQFLTEHLKDQNRWLRPLKFNHAYVIYPFAGKWPNTLRENEYIGVSAADYNRFRMVEHHIPKHKRVLLQPLTFRHKKDYNTHRLLRAVDKNTLLSKLGADQLASTAEMLCLPESLYQRFADFPELIENTQRLIKDCEVNFDFSRKQPQNQKYYGQNAKEDNLKIRALCEEGLTYRFGNQVSQTVLDRMEMELEVIQNMGFVSYFLINWDIVTHARNKGFFYVGRGSGANSLVAYLLRITNVDPIELDLFFERFINLYRANPPDFDIDFSWKDREEMTRYIFDRFKNTALIATYSEFKHRAIIHELSKVFGLPKAEADKLKHGNIRMAQLDELSRLVLRYGETIRKMPNLLSVHASGILISEKPIHYFSATQVPPKGFPMVQFDMVVAEDIGLYKFDILGQRGLAKIREAVDIVRINRPEAPEIDIHNVRPFLTDPKINKLVSEAGCLGCFYVESPAMRMLLKKLQVDNYVSLVAASSIIRPGVAKSGMMREYILRHRMPERAQQKGNKTLLNLMPETYGVMVYQEDVLKVAHFFAGLTLGEADVLRRGMSGKYKVREEFKEVKRKYIANCRAKGYPEKMYTEVWRQIESFAAFAFSKGHSASYAVESYQSLFLKTYYPLEYMVAVLNNGGGFYSAESYIHEARMLGGEIEGPCVNRSFEYSMIYGKTIYLGLVFIKDLEYDSVRKLVDERINHGAFKDFDDFLDRVPLGIEQLDRLIRVGAFRFTSIPKRQLLWQAHYFISKSKVKAIQSPLFPRPKSKYQLPRLLTTPLEDVFDQIEILGFPLLDPFLLVDAESTGGISAARLSKYQDQVVVVLGYLVHRKRTATHHGKEMNFGTFRDQSGSLFDTVHFPPVVQRYPFRGKGVYKVKGKVINEFGFYSIEVINMEKLPQVEDPRYAVKDKKPIHRQSAVYFQRN